MSKTAKPKREGWHLPTMGEKKPRPCLGCGKVMFTDAGHRICAKCHEHHANAEECRQPLSRGGGYSVHIPHQFRDLSSDADALWDY